MGASVEFGDLRDAAGVASPFEGSLEPNFDQARCHIVAKQVDTQAEDVGVIVTPTDLSLKIVMAECGPNTGELVSDNIHPDSGPPDQNGAVDFAIGDRESRFCSEVGIVTHLIRQRSEIQSVMVEFFDL